MRRRGEFLWSRDGKCFITFVDRDSVFPQHINGHVDVGARLKRAVYAYRYISHHQRAGEQESRDELGADVSTDGDLSSSKRSSYEYLKFICVGDRLCIGAQRPDCLRERVQWSGCEALPAC